MKLAQIPEGVFKWIKSNPFKVLIVVGIFISMSMYVSTIWLENFVCNPKTQDIARWIYRNMSFIFVFNDNPPFLDSLLFIGLISALIGTFFVYRQKKGSVYAIEQTLFIYSVFIAAMIFFTVDVTSWMATSLFGVNVAINGYPSWNYGFPTWTYQVTTLTAFLRYPDYTQDNPNAYFLNYWQLFTICVCIAVIMKFLIREQEASDVKKSQMVERGT